MFLEVENDILETFIYLIDKEDEYSVYLSNKMSLEYVELRKKIEDSNEYQKKLANITIINKYLYKPLESSVCENGNYFRQVPNDYVKLSKLDEVNLKIKVKQLLDELLIDMDSMDNLIGNWKISNLIYSETFNKIYNINLHNFYFNNQPKKIHR